MKHKKYYYPAVDSVFPEQPVPDEGTLFLDIETTGLSAKKETIYCIGLGYREADSCVVELLFAETPDEESQILALFQERLSDFRTCITFNGTTFDLPFLRTRFDFHQISHPLDSIPHRDLFIEIRKMKGLLQLDNYRQKSIEQFLSCDREDTYTGGELISIYYEYCFSKDPEKLELLLLHNHDDIKGMFYLPAILSLAEFCNGGFQIREFSVEYIKETPYANLVLVPGRRLPVSFHRHFDEITVALRPELVLVQLPIMHGILHHYFDNYKDYFYIPTEDTVIHKSLAQFMDASLRKKATKQNCFVSKECSYVSMPIKSCSCQLRQDCKEKRYYCEFSEDILTDEHLYEECSTMLKLFFQNFV